MSECYEVFGHELNRALPLLPREPVLTLSGPAFSVVRQAQGGSEAQMPKSRLTPTN